MSSTYFCEVHSTISLSHQGAYEREIRKRAGSMSCPEDLKKKERDAFVCVCEATRKLHRIQRYQRSYQRKNIDMPLALASVNQSVLLHEKMLKDANIEYEIVKKLCDDVMFASTKSYFREWEKLKKRRNS